MNRASDSQDYWSEEEYGDQSMYQAVLAAFAKPEPVTEREREGLVNHLFWLKGKVGLKPLSAKPHDCDKCHKICVLITGKGAK